MAVPKAYDGAAESWWDTEEDLKAGMESEAGQKAGQRLLEDQKKFIGLAHSPVWISQERPVAEAGS